MRQGAVERTALEHEGVYHAASQCQAASLALTPCRLHDVKRACSGAGQKTGGLASQQVRWLGSTWRMSLFGGNLVASIVNDNNIVMVVCPVQACIKHLMELLSSWVGKPLLSGRVLIQRCSKHIPLMINLLRRTAGEVRTPFIGRAKVPMRSFPSRSFHALSLCWVLALCREGLELV